MVFPFDRKLQFVLAGHKKDIAKLFDPGPSIMHSFHFLLLSFVFFFSSFEAIKAIKIYYCSFNLHNS